MQEPGRTAYTIGTEASREAVAAAWAAHRPETKMGFRWDRKADKASFESLAWKTQAEAAAFLRTYGAIAQTEGAVYELCLPNGWEADVSPEPDPHGAHRLLVDAFLVRAVDEG